MRGEISSPRCYYTAIQYFQLQRAADLTANINQRSSGDWDRFYSCAGFGKDKKLWLQNYERNHRNAHRSRASNYGKYRTLGKSYLRLRLLGQS